jgi:hypothetical protein
MPLIIHEEETPIITRIEVLIRVLQLVIMEFMSMRSCSFKLLSADVVTLFILVHEVVATVAFIVEVLVVRTFLGIAVLLLTERVLVLLFRDEFLSSGLIDVVITAILGLVIGILESSPVDVTVLATSAACRLDAGAFIRLKLLCAVHIPYILRMLFHLRPLLLWLTTHFLKY